MKYRKELEEMTRAQLVSEAVVVWDMLPSDVENFTSGELVEWCLGREEDFNCRFGGGVR